MLTCTVADLVPETAGAIVESDPVVAQLKSSVEMVSAIEPAVQFEDPRSSLTVGTDWVS